MTDDAPPEHPTPAMIDAMVRMYNQPLTRSDEALMHDLWQAGYGAWLAEQPPKAPLRKGFENALARTLKRNGHR